VVAGGFSSCALLSDGTARCWGRNHRGQLGDGTRKDRTKTPTPVVGLKNIKTIALGLSHGCAATAKGQVFCWGRNNYGQLGDGSTVERLRPVRVAQLAGVTQLALGFTHSCALTSGGEVMCWGDDRRHQLGRNRKDQRANPRPVFVVP